MLDTVISKEKENNKNNLPEASVAFTLPAYTPITNLIHPGPSRHSSLEEFHSQAIEGANQRVSTPETQNMPEQVQLTRSEASPSSAESDNPSPEPPGFNTSPSNIAHEPMSAQTPISVKSAPEKVLPIFFFILFLNGQVYCISRCTEVQLNQYGTSHIMR